MKEPETIREILENTNTIAVIGLSDKPGRASLGVSKFMQKQGYTIIPVNPLTRSVLGRRLTTQVSMRPFEPLTERSIW